MSTSGKSILFVPIKQYSERVPRKNFLVINGAPLYQHLPATALASGVFDKIVIDTDSKEVSDWASSVGIVTIPRLESLASNTANGNDLLRYHVALNPGYKFYWQGFVTTPNLSVDTFKKMDGVLRHGSEHDSVMTVESCRGFYWSSAGQPISYRPDVMPRSQDVPPLFKEKHGLFGISTESFAKTANRAGLHPYFYELPQAECVDIDWEKDLPSAAPDWIEKMVCRTRPEDYPGSTSVQSVTVERVRYWDRDQWAEKFNAIFKGDRPNEGASYQVMGCGATLNEAVKELCKRVQYVQKETPAG